MSSIALKISKKHYLQLVVPKEKENLYYEPTDKLHKFDLIQVFYVDLYKKKFIVEDTLEYIVSCFLEPTKKIMNGNLVLPSRVKPESFGHFYNCERFADRLWYEDDIFEYILWGVGNIQSVIYVYNSTIYIEVFPVFNFGEDASEEEDALNFKKFMNIYAPIGIMTLDKNTLGKWRKQFKEFFELKDDTIPY